MTATPTETPAATPIDVRVRISLIWTSIMLLVAFVDLFGLYRPDVRDQIEAGQAFVFDINGAFLLGVIIYVSIPTLMIALTVLLPWRASRIANVVVAGLFAATVAGAAIGEWIYYLLASAIELGLLATIIVLAVRTTRIDAGR